MIQFVPRSAVPRSEIWERALNARDPRFDGIFFVGITTTRVYCRPVCPARVSYTDRRRFFDTAAAAERAGFRPCLRCRPELAPGRAPMDAVPRLARVAADRISAGALNGRGVADLARDLGVSERHLRRALEREVGVSPLELAQTHRLLLAKRLLMDTPLSVTRIAFASGFQSLRRFNSVFRERYRLSPSALRKSSGRGRRSGAPRASLEAGGDLISLTLAYRPPLAWDALIELLGRRALPGVETTDRGRYARTIALESRTGIVLADDAARVTTGRGAGRPQLNVRVSASLLPALMPLLARLRRLFDLDAEPTVVDSHLAQGGLGSLVRRRPGVRVPGALDGFEAAFRAVLSDDPCPGTARALVSALGEPIESGDAALSRLVPTVARVAEAGQAGLAALGLSAERASVLAALACAMSSGTLRLEPGGNVSAALRVLMEVEGVDGRLATLIVMQAMYWPDAFPASDEQLQGAVGLPGPVTLKSIAERWRPWRAYAAHHLWLESQSPAPAPLETTEEAHEAIW